MRDLRRASGHNCGLPAFRHLLDRTTYRLSAERLSDNGTRQQAKALPRGCIGHLDEELWRNHPSETIERVYSVVADEQRLAIKNPGHTLRVSALKQMFPTARFVFVYRGEEDVIASMTRHNKRSFILPIAGLETNDDPRASAEIVWG